MQRLILGMIFMTVASRPALAQEDANTERARIHLKAAIAYYEVARYEDAVREMDAAYEVKPLPDLQYNLAQCYERLGRYEDAAKAYESYLLGNPSASDRKLVEARTENLRLRANAIAAGVQMPPPATTGKVVYKVIVAYKAPPGRDVRCAAGVGILAWAVGADRLVLGILRAGKRAPRLGSELAIVMELAPDWSSDDSPAVERGASSQGRTFRRSRPPVANALMRSCIVEEIAVRRPPSANALRSR
jgi:tetratricopeptide (TPR) repeat protein